GPVRIEDLKKMSEALALRLQAEQLVLFQGFSVQSGIVIERDAVKSEIGAHAPLWRLTIDVAALDVVQSRGAKGEGRLSRISATADNMDIGRVIDPRRWSHGAVIEDPLLNSQRLIGAGRHEHDVDHLLLDDLLDDVAKLRQAAVAQLRGVRFGGSTR